MSGESIETPRTSRYAKDTALEHSLAQANAWLGAHEPPASRLSTAAPITFVVGLQRSGSTLMMQLLAAAFALAWPDNLVARLWRAPALGMLLSRSLRQQCRPAPCFESDYGVTSSPFDPHEFGYFWQHWLPLSHTHEPGTEALAIVNVAALNATLAGMEEAAAAPLLFKGVALSLMLPFIASRLPASRFVWVRRPLLEVALSTYRGRVERHGSAAHWWSLRPASSAAMAAASPVDQVAMQVAYCEKRVVAALSALAPDRLCPVHYGELVAEPGQVLARLGNFLGQQPATVDLAMMARGRRDAVATDANLRKELATAIARQVARAGVG